MLYSHSQTLRRTDGLIRSVQLQMAAIFRVAQEGFSETRYHNNRAANGARRILTATFFHLGGFGLGFVASRQNVNEQNGQTNVQEYNHADHNCVWPLIQLH